uniref:Bestrophin homolog n=1 Tax=Ascaris lumbricoides TaxID=6252 RepID=A0A0M3I242_ASCLU
MFWWSRDPKTLELVLIYCLPLAILVWFRYLLQTGSMSWCYSQMWEI